MSRKTSGNSAVVADMDSSVDFEDPGMIESLRLLSCLFEVSKENKGAELLKKSPVTISLQNKDLRYVWTLNPKPFFTSDEILGKNDEELFGRENAHKLNEIKKKALRTRTGSHNEIQIVLGGKTYFFDMIIQPLSNCKGLLGICSDITEQKKTREELERYRDTVLKAEKETSFQLLKQAERLRYDIEEKSRGEFNILANLEFAESIVDTVSQPLVVLESDLRIVSANRGFYDKFHLKPNQTVGKYFYEIKGGQWNIPGFLKLLKEILPEQKSFENYELKIDSPKQGERIFLINARQFTGEMNRIFMLLTMDDITESRANEIEINKINMELEKKTADLSLFNRELEAFGYSVSHDLRAPLRSIDGFSQALEEDYAENLDAQGKAYLHRIRSAATRMGHLIDDLLSLSRITRAEMTIREVDMSSLASGIIEELKKTTQERTVEVKITPGMKVSGDNNLMKIALSNLLGNAWKFTSRNPEPMIEFSFIPGEPVTYYIKDNGAGFDIKYADKLFLPFQRLHTVEEFSGSGIGLSIVARIITRHGGRIWAEAETGKGATFFFTIQDKGD